MSELSNKRYVVSADKSTFVLGFSTGSVRKVQVAVSGGHVELTGSTFAGMRIDGVPRFDRSQLQLEDGVLRGLLGEAPIMGGTALTLTSRLNEDATHDYGIANRLHFAGGIATGFMAIAKKEYTANDNEVWFRAKGTIRIAALGFSERAAETLGLDTSRYCGITLDVQSRGGNG